MEAPNHAGVPKERETLESLAVVCGDFQKHLLSFFVGIVAPMAGREDAKLIAVGHAPNLGMRPPIQTIPHLCKPLPDSYSVRRGRSIIVQ